MEFVPKAGKELYKITYKTPSDESRNTAFLPSQFDKFKEQFEKVGGEEDVPPTTAVEIPEVGEKFKTIKNTFETSEVNVGDIITITAIEEGDTTTNEGDYTIDFEKTLPEDGEIFEGSFYIEDINKFYETFQEVGSEEEPEEDPDEAAKEDITVYLQGLREKYNFETTDEERDLVFEFYKFLNQKPEELEEQIIKEASGFPREKYKRRISTWPAAPNDRDWET